MIKLKVPLTDDVDMLEEMKEWCLSTCDRDNFYFFPQKLAIEEPATFWFENEEDAFAFQFKYRFVEEKIDEFERNC